jgi:hypothetical protein
MKKITVIFLIPLLICSCIRTTGMSQDIISRQSEQQTILMQQQVEQLKRIANALELLQYNRRDTFTFKHNVSRSFNY